MDNLFEITKHYRKHAALEILDKNLQFHIVRKRVPLKRRRIAPNYKNENLEQFSIFEFEFAEKRFKTILLFEIRLIRKWFNYLNSFDVRFSLVLIGLEI